MTPTTIFFIGKPGSGKGTQAKILAKETGWPVFGSGDQFRAIAEQPTPAGRKTREELDRGLLSPPWFAMYIYLQSLFSLSEDQNIIFDGFNRKEAEAQLVIDSLKWLGRPFKVLHIRVSDDEIRRRLEGRRTETNRADDHHIETRLGEYRTYTERAIEIFREAGVLVEINGEQDPEAVARDVKEAVGLA